MKSGSLSSIKNHISNYKLFYAVVTIALNPIWDAFKIYSLYWFDKISLLEWFEYYDLLIISVLVAFALKNIFSKWVSRFILASTLISQILLFTMIFDFLFDNHVICLFFIISIFIYFLWFTIYFLDENDLLHKKPTIIGMLFFVIMIILFYFMSDLFLEIDKYIVKTISPFSILSNFWVPIVLSSFIVFILFFVFMCIYKVKRSIF